MSREDIITMRMEENMSLRVLGKSMRRRFNSSSLGSLNGGVKESGGQVIISRLASLPPCPYTLAMNFISKNLASDKDANSLGIALSLLPPTLNFSMAAPLRAAEKAAEQAVVNVGTEIVHGDIDSKDTPARYLGYLARFRPILQPFSRYLACVPSSQSRGEGGGRGGADEG
jgi:hypothetical protein